MFQRIRKISEPSASLLLLLLLSADFVFIVLHVIIGIFDPNPSLCDISGICAYMNVFHLIKLFWVIVLFCYMLRLTRCSCYASWILMFTCFFIDDTLWLHQKIGDYIATISNDFFFKNPGLPSRYYELAVLAIAGLVLLAIVAWSFFHGPDLFRKISIDIMFFLAALVFFGIIVDIAETIKLGHIVIFGLGFVEDAGELMIYSLIVWYVFLLAMRNGKPDLFLHDLLFKSQTG